MYILYIDKEIVHHLSNIQYNMYHTKMCIYIYYIPFVSQSVLIYTSSKLQPNHCHIAPLAAILG